MVPFLYGDFIAHLAAKLDIVLKSKPDFLHFFIFSIPLRFEVTVFSRGDRVKVVGFNLAYLNVLKQLRLLHIYTRKIYQKQD